MWKRTPPFYMLAASNSQEGGEGHGGHCRGADWPCWVCRRFPERTYKLEERTELQEEKIRVANHRIDDLEGFHKPN